MDDHRAQARTTDVLPGRQLPRPVREFLHTESAGALVLLVATVAALVWANSPWDASYESLWHKAIDVRIGGLHLQDDLRHAVNEGLMAIFFFVAGLEIKRELVLGELRSWRRAALPVVAALGGMVVPALLFSLVNLGEPGARGWGVPMATDIAFALGVVALVSSRVPPVLRIFLLTLAIVDDLGAIVVIAVFYAGGVEWQALAVAALLLGVMWAMRAGGVSATWPFIIVGAAVWLATYQSGVHATIAGAVLGLLAPARPLTPAVVTRDWAQDLSDEPDAAEMQTMAALARNTTSVVERLEHQLHPVASFVVLPLFALANAGIVLDLGALDAPGATPVAAGVVLGLVVGKALGITAFSWLAVRAHLAALPTDMTWGHVGGVAVAAGVGFTVSLFIAGLAFSDPRLEAAAKLGVLAASITAAVVGAALLALASGRAQSEPSAGRISSE